MKNRQNSIAGLILLFLILAGDLISGFVGVGSPAPYDTNQAYAVKTTDSLLTTACDGPQASGGLGNNTEVSIGLGVNIVPKTTKKIDVWGLMGYQLPAGTTLSVPVEIGVWRTTGAIPAFGVVASGTRVLYSQYQSQVPNAASGLGYLDNTMHISGQDSNTVVLGTSYNYYLSFDCGIAIQQVMIIHGNGSSSGALISGTQTDILVQEF